MHSYTLIAPAKINLYLEIIGDRPDGYHELVMILQSIDLADTIELRPNGTEQIRLHCNNLQVPLDVSNLAYRAVEVMREEFPKIAANYGGVDIFIDKKIPVAAGLAGGSTNGAAVLVGINLMWELGLTIPELQTLGAKLGLDVPFCISGGTAIATGRGEQLDPIVDLDNLWVVLAKYRSLSVSTAWAYKTYKQKFGSSYISDSEGVKSRTAQMHSGSLVSAIAHKDGASIGKLLYNDLEKVVLPAFPQVAQLREAFQEVGCLGTVMSGSGPTVFALCESSDRAEIVRVKVRETIPDPDLEFWVAQLSSAGIEVASFSK
ncbi:4-diphosphocytidyl-2C-methyl-D-erythritol kinase [Pleurocapsa sp. PCC 7327]|uniref:4-(cytidine 5'-diphospho)-2-C-methyl-D-erythritol kinase n=1 Tax=Pleurocapsa sp. PCC 7327 TaxID=118163 RepID=UPI00029FFA1A|nr:4-(cytidine 5'-diphospho)-2-C-methyl-D-erythritol kinase [Pleurocapsa sp. PCC 7327]AFY78467.1 4-diphosphocytidyl-2C-methyl-D-erythritol kinase [Pleurocapsa sp. PCC 7327]